MLSRLAGTVALLWGWQRAFVAGLAGVLAAFAQAPYHAFPVLWVSLPLLVWLLDGAVDVRSNGRIRRLWPAFSIGWAFGFGYFLNGLWWIGNAFLVDADQYAWALPIAVIALPIGLGLFHGVATTAARLVWINGPGRIAVLAITWTVVEYARGHVLTGFPWIDLGYALAANTLMMQSAAIVGLYGLTLPAILIFAAPAALDGRRSGRLVFAGAMAILALHVGYGVIRMALAEPGIVEGVRLRLMQPAVTEWTKWQPGKRAELLGAYIDLSRKNAKDGSTGLNGITHLIWPESPFSFLLARESWALTSIADLLKTGPTTLITGAIRSDPAVSADASPHFFNSIYVIGSTGEILSAYDKAHLVPFGEYLPLERTLNALGIQQLTQIKSSFSTGPGPRTLSVPGAPSVGMTICYEAVFPGRVVDPLDRPSWLVNLTNDAWFGYSPGPYQHLHQARLRSVEEGLPMIRVANSGVTAAIDPWGRVAASLPLGKVGTIDVDLPRALSPTIYSNNRDIAVLIELGLVTLFTLFSRRRFKQPIH